MFSAEGHEHRGRADGGVEAFDQALVGGHVQVGDHRVQALGERVARPIGNVAAALFDVHVHVLGRAVARKEFAGYVHDGVAAPGHAHATAIGDDRDRRGFEVFCMRKLDEALHVLRRERDRHALLTFGDGELGAVEAFVFLGYAIEVDLEAVGQLADGDRNAACTEIVAALDHAAGLGVAEQALDLALDRRVALLHFRAARFDGLEVVRFGRARCAADAVAAGASAEQDDHIFWSRGFTANISRGRCAHHRADLHALCGIAGVVKLVHLARCQTDLVAVGRKACCCRGDELALRQLAGKRFGHRDQRICRARYAHRLVDVAAARKRVADRAAHAGCRTAEGLDLRGMIVCFVLEEVEPILLFAVHIHLHLHGAGVDLFGFVEVREDALALEPFRADRAHVHERNRLRIAVEIDAHAHILVERCAHLFVVDLHVLELGLERGVTAVIGPVGVDHLDLSDGGVALLAREILLAELDVGQVHG